jgi:urease accessory protein
VKGHLHLICSRNSLGQNHLRRQSFRAPMHLSKPHDDEDTLVVNLVTPTAGVFDDDEIDYNIQVEANARLTLTTPSSSRVYRSRSGSTGKVHQHLHVGPGAFLEYFPEPFIPHSGARYHQQNSLHVDEGGSLLFFEWLSPGRVASGESFQYHELRWDTDLWFANQLVARERYSLTPAQDSVSALTMTFPHAHYLGCFITGIDPPHEAIDALNNADVYIGCGPLIHGGHAIKAVCNGSLAARKTLRVLREILYAAHAKKPPHLGRFG